MPQRSARSPQRLTLYSRRSFGELDGRTAEANEEQRLIAELTAHVGQL
jgi:hypothetical protein